MMVFLYAHEYTHLAICVNRLLAVWFPLSEVFSQRSLSLNVFSGNRRNFFHSNTLLFLLLIWFASAANELPYVICECCRKFSRKR